jgi:electron transport complex protein RnfG
MSPETSPETNPETRKQPGSASATRTAREPAWKLVLVLTGVCAVAGAGLAAGHMLSKEPIQKARYNFKMASIEKVLPDCENDPGADTVAVELPGEGKTTVYRCRIDGRIEAVAFSLDTEKNKNPTYSGPIEVLVGIDTRTDRIYASKAKKRVGVTVLKHSETPGLGAKIEDESFLSNFYDGNHVGRNLTQQNKSCDKAKQCKVWAVTKDDSRGFVDAISGATISSRAMTEVVQRALRYYKDEAVKRKMLSNAGGKKPNR